MSSIVNIGIPTTGIQTQCNSALIRNIIPLNKMISLMRKMFPNLEHRPHLHKCPEFGQQYNKYEISHLFLRRDGPIFELPEPKKVHGRYIPLIMMHHVYGIILNPHFLNIEIDDGFIHQFDYEAWARMPTFIKYYRTGQFVKLNHLFVKQLCKFNTTIMLHKATLAVYWGGKKVKFDSFGYPQATRWSKWGKFAPSEYLRRPSTYGKKTEEERIKGEYPYIFLKPYNTVLHRLLKQSQSYRLSKRKKGKIVRMELQKLNLISIPKEDYAIMDVNSCFQLRFMLSLKTDIPVIEIGSREKNKDCFSDIESKINVPSLEHDIDSFDTVQTDNFVELNRSTAASNKGSKSFSLLEPVEYKSSNNNDTDNLTYEKNLLSAYYKGAVDKSSSKHSASVDEKDASFKSTEVSIMSLDEIYANINYDSSRTINRSQKKSNMKLSGIE